MSLLRLSNSEMGAWRRCPRKWYLATYRRLKPKAGEKPGSSLHIGNTVHDALAAYYGDRTDPVAFAQGALDFEAAAQPEFTDEYRKTRELVTAMLEGYIEWLAETGADGDLRLLGAEKMVEVPLVEGVNLLSKLDAPVERISDGARLALEHKTVSSLDQPLPLLKIDTQLLTEHLARFLHARTEGASNEEAYDQCHGVLYNMLRKVKRTASAKPPFYDRIDVPHNIHELRSHWRHVLALAREIQDATARLDAGEEHHTVCPPSPRRDCTWDCPFFKVCVMADDGSDFEGALSALYEERDPLERYENTEEL